MKKEVLVRRDVFFAICAAYVTIPVIIFLAGYIKPVIGIPRLREYDDKYINYIRAVAAGGAEPKPLEPVHAEIDRQIAECDGFLFMGGPDFSQRLSDCKLVRPHKTLSSEWEEYYYDFGKKVLLETNKLA